MLIDKYTRSLYNILEVDKKDIWEGIDFGLPDFVDLDKIKTMFKSRWLYYEIGSETVTRFLTELANQVELLKDRFTMLFNSFKDAYTDKDIYNNNSQDAFVDNKNYRTPQTQIGVLGDYLSEENTNESRATGLNGLTKAEARQLYIERERQIYYEYIEAFKPLFLTLF